MEYFVSWVGYPNEDDDCWITEDSAEYDLFPPTFHSHPLLKPNLSSPPLHFRGAPDAISAYWESVPVAKRSARYASGVVPDSASTKKSAKSTASTSTPKVDTPVTSGTKRSAAKAADEKEESARSKKKATNGGSSAAKARKSSPALGSAKKKSKAATPAVAEPSKTEEMEVDDNPLGGPANGEEDVDGRKFFAHHLEKDYIKNKSWEVCHFFSLPNSSEPTSNLLFSVYFFTLCSHSLRRSRRLRKTKRTKRLSNSSLFGSFQTLSSTAAPRASG